jgi:hypothetical protein
MRMSNRSKPAVWRLFSLLSCPFLLTLIFLFETSGWGWNAHRFINGSSVYHLPNSMVLFVQDSSLFAEHSTDADQRRVSGDTSLFAEGPRHYLDIDDYPDFQNLPQDLDTLIRIYGWERVKQNGTIPWATIWVYDSLVAQLSRGDWTTAKLTASDLGHYVADAHQPLHCTLNYNGQFTDNYGIHSRYESGMLSPDTYLSSLFIVPDSTLFIADRLSYAFDYIRHSNGLVDSVLRADNHAKTVSGWNGSGTPPGLYYVALWEETGAMTLDLMQRGTRALANLWYTAWVDAGLLTPTDVEVPAEVLPAEFHLAQNFPNPFNGQTVISYTLPVGGTVSLVVYSLDGREVATILRENQSAGQHTVYFDGFDLASGAYFYRLQLGKFTQTRKFVLLR